MHGQFRYSSQHKELLVYRIDPQHCRVDGFEVLDVAGVKSILDEHRAGTADHTQMLWALFCLDRWYDEYVAPAS